MIDLKQEKLEEMRADALREFTAYDERYDECLDAVDERLTNQIQALAKGLHVIANEFNIPVITVLREMVEPSLEWEVDSVENSRS